MRKGRKPAGDPPPPSEQEGQEPDREKGPTRTCVITRAEYPRERLLRFVADPEGRIMEDLSGRLPGRGVYIHPAPANLSALLKRPAILSRMAGRPVQPPSLEVLTGRLETGLLRRLLDGVGLARRAGMTRFGLDELLELLLAGQMPFLILLAADTAIHTREKLARMLARQTIPPPVLELLHRAELGAACGHKPVAVLSVLNHGLARRIENDGRRWLDFHGIAGVEGATAMEAASPEEEAQESLPLHNEGGLS